MPDETSSKPEYEKAKAAELLRQEEERRQAQAGHEKGKQLYTKEAKAKGTDPIQIDESIKFLDTRYHDRFQKLLQEQQRRMDELELRHLGPPSERDKGRER